MLKNNGFHNRKKLYFSPLSLFAQGEQGVWYDPSDLSTMFQDSAGTTPVTAVGQPVGRILDKSGRGNHAFQTTTTKRPFYQSAGGYSYLAFDGVDDALVTNSIDFTATDKMSIWMGITRIGTASNLVILELGVSNNTGNSFGIFMPVSTNTAEFGLHGPAGPQYEQRRYADGVAPSTSIWAIGYNRAASAGSQISTRRNGVAGGFNATYIGTSGVFDNSPLNIGMRNQATLPFNGNIYSLIVRGAQSSDYQIAATENYVNGKTGAF